MDFPNDPDWLTGADDEALRRQAQEEADRQRVNRVLSENRDAIAACLEDLRRYYANRGKHYEHHGNWIGFKKPKPKPRKPGHGFTDHDPDYRAASVEAGRRSLDQWNSKPSISVRLLEGREWIDAEYFDTAALQRSIRQIIDRKSRG